jgi:hypothetical protein
MGENEYVLSAVVPQPIWAAKPSSAPITSPKTWPPACDGNYEGFKLRWVQYCEADFAALPAAMQTRFLTEVLGRRRSW